MNNELLKAKMDEFFAKVTPNYLVQEFEKMGYAFVDCEINWAQPSRYDLVCPHEDAGLLSKLFRKRKIEKNLTSEYPGSFFFP